MCGIAGLVYQGAPEEGKDIIQKMTRAMAHRGPDGEGIFSHETIFLGHRRLSILDLSEKGNQPMTDASGRYVITYNGEIYNFRQLRTEIKNYHFTTESDCEVILAACKEWGVEALHRLVGMWAFAIYDKEERSLFLARD